MDMTTAQIEPRAFKSMTIALKELEPYIRDGRHLQTGKPFHNFSELRSRELLSNWLICAAVNANTGSDRAMFSSDPTGGDGLLWDKIMGQSFRTEHVMVPELPDQTAPIDVRILAAIAHKQKRGSSYGNGKILVVFTNAGSREPWFPNRVAKQLPSPNYFDQIWVTGLEWVEDGRYVYNLARLEQLHSPAWRVKIARDFQSWEVEPLQ